MSGLQIDDDAVSGRALMMLARFIRALPPEAVLPDSIEVDSDGEIDCDWVGGADSIWLNVATCRNGRLLYAWHDPSTTVSGGSGVVPFSGDTVPHEIAALLTRVSQCRAR